jgi:hypothetical protein
MKIEKYQKLAHNKKTCYWITDSDITKTERKEGSMIERRSIFFSNGKLKKTKESVYNEEYEYESSLGSGGMAIGVDYLYNEEGIVIETTEYEYDFKITEEDVVACIKEEYPNFDESDIYIVGIGKDFLEVRTAFRRYNSEVNKSYENIPEKVWVQQQQYPRKIVNGEIKLECKWFLHIVTGTDFMNPRYIWLDGNTGEKCEDYVSSPHTCRVHK